MKNFTKFLILASLLVVLFALPAQVNAQDPTNQLTTDDGGKVVFGSSYTLRSGETLAGDLVVFGGSAAIEEAPLSKAISPSLADHYQFPVMSLAVSVPWAARSI
ncbi:hypothetical protein FDZ74_06785 [bacterium]|nr:MAG: hypothetical protein FDZ74_06785 [bacterium]